MAAPSPQNDPGWVKTVAYAQRLERTGISALTVHSRDRYAGGGRAADAAVAGIRGDAGSGAGGSAPDLPELEMAAVDAAGVAAMLPAAAIGACVVTSGYDGNESLATAAPDNNGGGGYDQDAGGSA